VPLKLRQTVKYCQHQPSVGRCGIGPRITEGFERSASFGDLSKRVEQIASASCQSIELADNQIALVLQWFVQMQVTATNVLDILIKAAATCNSARSWLIIEAVT
jgi:hypothetical protein